MKTWLAALACALLTACAPTRYYTESFSELLVAADGSTFAVLGEQYHYLFDMPEPMAKSLASDVAPYLTGHILRDFHVGRSGRTSGYARLQLTEAATGQARAQARALGYGTTDEGLIYYTFFLTGQRYAATSASAQAPVRALDRAYHVRVVDSQASQDALALFSPVIFVAGTGFVLANPATLLITLPVAGLKP